MGKKSESVDFRKKVFDIKQEPMPRGAWWWWFWLFFFDNPKNPAKPRQLMILWSAKNVKEIDCNGLKIQSGNSGDRSKLRGAVAAWYFDGEKMHHNFILEPCDIRINGSRLSTASETPTSFSIDAKRSVVKIGKGFEFIAEENGKHGFKTASYHSNNIIGDKGYSIMKVNRADLSGKVNGKPIRGTAYFQRVFVNAPAIPWYWGIFHFGNGGVLTYTNQLVFGKSMKKDISFFDGKVMHRFDTMNVKRSGDDIPAFMITGENGTERISFSVQSYEHSSWTFRKKSFGFIPNKLVYNEYPAVISGFEMVNKKTGKRVVLKALGKSVGNAEHTTGFLL